MGLNPQWRQEYPTVICVGECTRRVAKEGGYIHIPDIHRELVIFIIIFRNEEWLEKVGKNL